MASGDSFRRGVSGDDISGELSRKIRGSFPELSENLPGDVVADVDGWGGSGIDATSGGWDVLRIRLDGVERLPRLDPSDAPPRLFPRIRDLGFV